MEVQRLEMDADIGPDMADAVGQVKRLMEIKGGPKVVEPVKPELRTQTSVQKAGTDETGRSRATRLSSAAPAC